MALIIPPYVAVAASPPAGLTEIVGNEISVEPEQALPATSTFTEAIAGSEYTALIGVNAASGPIAAKVTVSDGTVVGDATFEPDGTITRDVFNNAAVDGASTGANAFLDFGFYPMFGEGTYTVEVTGQGNLYYISVFEQ